MSVQAASVIGSLLPGATFERTRLAGLKGSDDGGGASCATLVQAFTQIHAVGDDAAVPADRPSSGAPAMSSLAMRGPARHRTRRDVSPPPAAVGGGGNRDALAASIGSAALRELRVDPSPYGAAALAALGREVVADYAAAAPAQRAQFMVGLAGLMDVAGAAAPAATIEEAEQRIAAFLHSRFKYEMPVYAAMTDLAALQAPTRYAMAKELLVKAGLDPGRPVDVPRLVDPENILAENDPKPAADYYYNYDALSRTDIERMSARPLSGAGIERIHASLPASLDAAFAARFDAYVAQAAAAGTRLVQAWLAGIAARENVAVTDLAVTLSRATLTYRRMQRMHFRDEVFHYPTVTAAEIRADGYFAVIRTAASTCRYFLCARTGRAYRLPAQGTLSAAIKACREIVFGKADMHAIAAKHPNLRLQRVVVEDLASGSGGNPQDWLTPVSAAEAERGREAARGQTPGEEAAEALLNSIIPFRAMVIAIRKGDVAQAVLAAGMDILSLIPFMGLGLRALKGGVALGRLALMEVRRGGIAGLRAMAGRIPAARDGIRTGLGMLTAGARLCGRLRPLDADRVAASLKSLYPELAEALEKAAATERGPAVRDGWWRVGRTDAGAGADEGIQTLHPDTAHAADGTTATVLPYAEDGHAYTLYDDSQKQRVGAVLVRDRDGWLYEALPAPALEQACVATPSVLEALSGKYPAADGTIVLDGKHYARIGADYIEVVIDRAVSVPDRPIWRVAMPAGVSPDIVVHRLMYDRGKALWRRAQVPGLKAGGASYSRQAIRGPLQDGLLGCVRGSPSGRQLLSLRTIQARLQGDPRGAAILRALRAHHELLGRSIDIYLHDGPIRDMARPRLERPVDSNIWYLSPQALENAPVEEVVRELAAAYNNMTGILRGENPFARVLAGRKPRLDFRLEKAWRQWQAEAPPAIAASRRQATDMLRGQLREMYCYGGMSRSDLEAILRMEGETSGRPGARIQLVRMQLDSVPPLPDGIQSLDLTFNRITDWRHLPRSLAVLDISQNGLSRLPETLPPDLKVLKAVANELTALPSDLPRHLKRLDVSSNRLGLLPRLPDTLERLFAAANDMRALPGDLPASLKKIDVDHNSIERLPSDLPSSLEVLHVSNNALKALPDSLPSALKVLHAESNRIALLPRLPAGLRKLNVSRNLLEALPALPQDLQMLIVRSNRLRSLPTGMPDGLSYLQASGNQLTDLPDDIGRLHACAIYLEGNPISAESIPVFREGEPAPRIFLPAAQTNRAWPGYSSSMTQALRKWLEGESEDALVHWEAIVKDLDPGSRQAFSRFLDRLRDTASVKDAAFRADVVDWLVELSRPERTELREATLGACLGATASCDDRVSWTLNNVKILRLNDDIRLGRYDGRAGEVIAAARQMFRLNVLTGIARRKVASMGILNEVEAYLAYVVKLRDALDLTTVVPDMHYYAVSGVSEADLEAARYAVQRREDREFAEFLALDYEPWATFLQRNDVEAYTAAQRALAEQGEARFEQRLQEEVAKLDLDPTDTAMLADVRKDLGPMIMREVRYRIWKPLIRKYLGPLERASFRM